MQAIQSFDECGVVGLALLAVRLDARQEYADGIDEGEQSAGDVGRDEEDAVAEFAQEVLPGVRDRAEGVEVEEPRGALDRVDGAKDVRQHVAVARVLLEDYQIAVELIEVFVTLDQELAHHFV